MQDGADQGGTLGHGTETAPVEGADQQAKLAARRDKALAFIVLAVELSLHYLIGADPSDPLKVWKTLADQFQKKIQGK